MNPLLASAIRVIREEGERTLDEFERQDPESARSRWEWDYLPFQAEVCLAVLVSINHEVERELVQMAARATPDGKEQTWSENRELVKRERRKLHGDEGWARLYATLHQYELGRVERHQPTATSGQ